MKPQKLRILPTLQLLQRQPKPAVGQAAARPTLSISSTSRRACWGGVAFGAITFAVRLSGVTFSSVLGATAAARCRHPMLLLAFCRVCVVFISFHDRELRLGGWSKIGFPGVIVVEGGEL